MDSENIDMLRFSARCGESALFGSAVIEEAPEVCRGVCWCGPFEGVLPAFEGDALSCGDLPFSGDRDREFCDERKFDPFNCFDGVLGVVLCAAFGLAGEREGEDTPFVGAVSDRVESTRTRLSSPIDTFFFTAASVAGTTGNVCARTTTGDAVPEPGRRCGIELDSRLLKMSGVGVAFGDRFLRALALDIESDGAVELALRLSARTARDEVGGAVAIAFVRVLVSRVADDRMLVVRDTRVDVVDGACRDDISRLFAA